MPSEALTEAISETKIDPRLVRHAMWHAGRVSRNTFRSRPGRVTQKTKTAPLAKFKCWVPGGHPCVLCNAHCWRIAKWASCCTLWRIQHQIQCTCTCKPYDRTLTKTRRQQSTTYTRKTWKTDNQRNGQKQCRMVA